MNTVQGIPQAVVVKVHALATGRLPTRRQARSGVAADEATFAIRGRKDGP